MLFGAFCPDMPFFAPRGIGIRLRREKMASRAKIIRKVVSPSRHGIHLPSRSEGRVTVSKNF
jgi:hypothetical protein